jgi:hypothetical protein
VSAESVAAYRCRRDVDFLFVSATVVSDRDVYREGAEPI